MSSSSRTPARAGTTRPTNAAPHGTCDTILDTIPGLTLIACHFGGYHRLEEAREHVVGSAAYLETSWPPSLGGLAADQVRDLIASHGADRVVYGSDWPMTDPAAEIAAIRSLGLPPDQEEAVLGGNLARVLGLG